MSYSNSLHFLRTVSDPPTIVAISPSSADRNCLQKHNCPLISVYGHGFATGLSIQCVFFGTQTRPGQYHGTVTTLPNGTKGSYDYVSCPQIPPYNGVINGSSVTQSDGFYLSIYFPVSGYLPSSTTSFTYTCDPCD